MKVVRYVAIAALALGSSIASAGSIHAVSTVNQGVPLNDEARSVIQEEQIGRPCYRYVCKAGITPSRTASLSITWAERS
jgi:hypothetical protein